MIAFADCTGHFYHKECAEGFSVGKPYVKCGVCFKIYGDHIGDMPYGTMSWTHYHAGSLPLASHEKVGTWNINYNFPYGKKEDGTDYSGTGRTAYLPDTPEGREVLVLLQKSFKL